MVQLNMFKCTILVIFVAASFGWCTAGYASDYQGYKVYKITPRTEQHLDVLRDLIQTSEIDVWTASKVLGDPTVLMVPPMLQRTVEGPLKANGLKYKTIIKDLQRVVEKERYQQRKAARRHDSRISFDRYERFDTIQNYLKNLTNSFPKLTKLINIGESFEGRQLNVLKVSSGGNGNKPAIFVDGGIHAREWIAPATVLYIIKQLVENNAANKALTDNIDWYILPVLNPDGYEYTHEKSRFWRKNRTPNSNNCYGTDQNRNYDFHWMEVGASLNPCSDTYAGAHAFSEPENKALSNFALSLKKQLKLYLTFHSYGQYILYPWGWTSDLPDNAEELHKLGQLANDVSGYKYLVGSSTNVLYAAAGGSDDWFKGVAGVPLSYTIELPGGGASGFDLPSSKIDGVVKDTFKMVKVFGNYVDEKFGGKSCC